MLSCLLWKQEIRDLARLVLGHRLNFESRTELPHMRHGLSSPVQVVCAYHLWRAANELPRVKTLPAGATGPLPAASVSAVSLRSRQMVQRHTEAGGRRPSSSSGSAAATGNAVVRLRCVRGPAGPGPPLGEEQALSLQSLALEWAGAQPCGASALLGGGSAAGGQAGGRAGRGGSTTARPKSEGGYVWDAGAPSKEICGEGGAPE